MTPFTLRETALAGLIAAVYALLGLFFAPISFAVYQIRVAEALTVMPYITRAAIPGLFAGCALANLFGSQGWPDIVFGSLLTLFAAILTRSTRNLAGSRLGRRLALLPVALLWIGGLLLIVEPSRIEIWLPAAILAVVSCWFGFGWWPRGEGSGIGAGLLITFSGAAAIVIIVLADWRAESIWSTVVGGIAVLAAWGMTGMVRFLFVTGRDVTTALAPLPPVLINALGVPLYLAPLYGLDYWFSVQMIGVGQLIACYLLGLPLLHLMARRMKRISAAASATVNRGEHGVGIEP